MYKVFEAQSSGFSLEHRPDAWYRGSPTSFEPLVVSLEKLAAEIRKGVIAPELIEYMKHIKPDPKHRYILVAPLGASEYWGPNNRGDIWPEKALNPMEKNAWWGYKTFEGAKVFREHLNKDPNLALGEVIKAAWNDDMKRVEVIARIDVDKAPRELIKAIDAGEPVEVSMGAKIPEGDVCSICGNRAKNRFFYCEHLREKMASIEKDGRYVGAINEKPVFFDLSIVYKPAAEESGVLRKVANKETNSATLGDLAQKLTNREKYQKLIHLVERKQQEEPDLPLSTLLKLATYPTDLVLGTLSSLGIILKPGEFQTLVFAKENPKIASIFYQSKLTFRPRKTDSKIVIPRAFSEKIASGLESFLFPRSVLEPYLLARLLGVEKTSSSNEWQQTVAERLQKIASVYSAYLNGLEEYYKERYRVPSWLLSSLVEGDLERLVKLSSDVVKKLVNVPLVVTYISTIRKSFD